MRAGGRTAAGTAHFIVTSRGFGPNPARGARLVDTDLVRDKGDRDVIRDFDAARDTIFFEAGAVLRAVLRFVEDRNGNLIIRLKGDRGTIVVRDAGIGAVANFEGSNDLFLA